MSFARQEEVLLALLFDRKLREAFLRDRDDTLAKLDLTDEERADFRSIRRAGLEIDAETRRDLVLARICRSLPLSFSIASALAPGVAERLLSADLFRVAAVERTRSFGERLRDAIDAAPLVRAILDVELGIVTLASSARRAAMMRGCPDEALGAIATGWESRRLRLAPNTAVFALPRSHGELLRELCPCPPDQLWTRLQHAPLPRQRLEHALSDEQPRLLVVGVHVPRASRCEASIAQRTVELSDGFLPMLQEVARGTTTRDLLVAMRHAGGNDAIVAGVKKGIQALVKEHLLID